MQINISVFFYFIVENGNARNKFTLFKQNSTCSNISISEGCHCGQFCKS